ncbi:MAG: quinone oxidoreductase [Alphaproteobacteria bacterium]|nr:quinone oxidoreductase [Alphaproteobacteria bacterium]
MPVEAWVVQSPGGVETMEWRHYSDLIPKGHEVLVRHTVVGVSYIDVFHRNGVYPAPKPLVPGTEATGIVEAVGPNVKGFKEGDRIVYATLPVGSYGTKRLIHERYLIKIPDYLDDEPVAACFLRGLTAHYLLTRLVLIMPGSIVLVHAAAGGLGQILCQWASAGGAMVIGTVGSDHKIAHAKKAGCHAVINYTKYPRFSEIVMGITKGEGVKVVYDGVGKATFYESLKCLSSLGLMASIGEPSGLIDNFEVAHLAARSLFLSRPTVYMYKADRNELVLSASEVFTRMEQGIIRPHIHQILPIAQVAKAHKDLEARKVIGQQVLKVS